MNWHDSMHSVNRTLKTGPIVGNCCCHRIYAYLIKNINEVAVVVPVVVVVGVLRYYTRDIYNLDFESDTF